MANYMQTMIQPRFETRLTCFNTYALFSSRRWLLADRNPFVVGAHLALHVAAPVELAVTPLRPLHLQGVVASAAAQCLAIVNAGAGLVAQTARGSRRVHQRVGVAEVGRPLEVQQLHLPGSLAVSLKDPAVGRVGHVHLYDSRNEYSCIVHVSTCTTVGINTVKYSYRFHVSTYTTVGTIIVTEFTCPPARQ